MHKMNRDKMINYYGLNMKLKRGKKTGASEAKIGSKGRESQKV